MELGLWWWQRVSARRLGGMFSYVSRFEGGTKVERGVKLDGTSVWELLRRGVKGRNRETLRSDGR